MNIISNNCAGAECYKLTNLEFNNPFMWTCIFAADMIRLIQNYDNVNWIKVKPVILSKAVAKENNYNRYQDRMPGLNIDNTFNLYFTHYLYDAHIKTPTRKGVDIYYYKNYEIGATKYFKRLQRMINNIEPVTFLILTYKRHGWNVDWIQQLIKTDSNHKIILITDYNLNHTPLNIQPIYEPKLNTTECESPRVVVEKYLANILAPIS